MPLPLTGETSDPRRLTSAFAATVEVVGQPGIAGVVVPEPGTALLLGLGLLVLAMTRPHFGRTVQI